MEDMVQIKKFNVIGNDERGITAEFSLLRKQHEFVYISRKAGSLSGNTYHGGKSSATNPKIFILLMGKIIFSYRKINTDIKYQKEVEAPAMIEVAPLVTHNVEALADCIFLECNSIEDIQNDRTREDV